MKKMHKPLVIDDNSDLQQQIAWLKNAFITLKNRLVQLEAEPIAKPKTVRAERAPRGSYQKIETSLAKLNQFKGLYVPNVKNPRSCSIKVRVNMMKKHGLAFRSVLVDNGVYFVRVN